MGVNAANLRLGPANVYIYEKPRASLTIQTALMIHADRTGIGGNSITVALVTGTALAVAVAGQAITVTLGSGSTAAQVRDAIMASFAARSLVYATLAAGESGSTAMTAAASAPLTGGSDTGTPVDVGALGEGLQVVVGTAAQELTAAQTGNVAQDEVVTGGQVTFTVPFKEMVFENFARAIPNARVIEGADGKRRLDFVVRVGESRRQFATRLELRPMIGGVETTDPNEIYIVPLATAVAADVTIPFSPTAQQEMSATFRAWPDANGRWMFKGSETL